MGKKITFDIEEPSEEFDRHLKIPFNDRIILSAPFGSGKTYFLKKYFKDHSEYEVVHLYPVNYSVTSNEDIFELIKYDILYELLKKNLDFDKTDFNKLDYLPIFLKDNPLKTVEALTPFISLIPTIGKSLLSVKENLVKLYKKFDQDFKKVNTDDKKDIIAYLESFTEVSGSIKEEDFYTQLICQLVNQLKLQTNEKGESTKETFLIVDDLDRIDPDHLFRILNVFSAQMDRNDTNNKFNFDKIILVFDQENVRNIFENRYGANVDYTGYIDKFYAHKIFEFSNAHGLKKKIIELLNTIKTKNQRIDFNKENIDRKGVVYVFERLLEANVLTVRRLLKVLGSKINYEYSSIKLKNTPGSYEEHKFHILFIARILLFIFDDWEELLNSLNKAVLFKKEVNPQSKFKSVIQHCLIILDVEQHMLQQNVENIFTQTIDENDVKITYKIYYNHEKEVYSSRISHDGIESENFEPIVLLVKTLEKIKNENLLKQNYI